MIEVLLCQHDKARLSPIFAQCSTPLLSITTQHIVEPDVSGTNCLSISANSSLSVSVHASQSASLTPDSAQDNYADALEDVFQRIGRYAHHVPIKNSIKLKARFFSV